MFLPHSFQGKRNRTIRLKIHSLIPNKIGLKKSRIESRPHPSATNTRNLKKCGKLQIIVPDLRFDGRLRKRKPFNFNILNIHPSAVLGLGKDDSITWEVVDEKWVRFRNEIMSLSASANIIFEELNYDWGGRQKKPA